MIDSLCPLTIPLFMSTKWGYKTRYAHPDQLMCVDLPPGYNDLGVTPQLSAQTVNAILPHQGWILYSQTCYFTAPAPYPSSTPRRSMFTLKLKHSWFHLPL